jgi:hypothetical protein
LQLRVKHRPQKQNGKKNIQKQKLIFGENVITMNHKDNIDIVVGSLKS